MEREESGFMGYINKLIGVRDCFFYVLKEYFSVPCFYIFVVIAFAFNVRIILEDIYLIFSVKSNFDGIGYYLIPSLLLVFAACVDYLRRKKDLYAMVAFYFECVVLFGCIYFLLNFFDESGKHFDKLSIPVDKLNNMEAIEYSYSSIEYIFDHVYFSLVNMTTVGFGNIYPTSKLAMFIAGIQVLLGLYLVVVAINSTINEAVDKRKKEEEEKAKAPFLACARTDVSDFLYDQMAFINYLCLQSEVLGDRNNDDLYHKVMDDVVSGVRKKRINNELKINQDKPEDYIEGLNLLCGNILNRYSLVLNEKLYYSVFYVDRFNRKYMLDCLDYNSGVNWKEYFDNISDIYDWCDSFETGDHSIMVDREVEDIMKGYFKLRLK